jgi:predicted dehydrogenase
MQNSPVRLALIGCGFVALDRHLPALRHVPEVEVVAAADRHSARAIEALQRFPEIGRTAEVEEVLADPRVEAVAICTPPATHAELTLAALEAGKHVFLEKPIAPTLEEADRLIEHADRSSHAVMVGFNFRRHRFVEQARRVVSEGTLGRIQALRTAFTSPILDRKLEWHGQRSVGGGSLFDRAIHHFDLWRFLLGAEVAEVFAFTQSERSDDQCAVVTGRTTDGTPLCTLALDDSVVTHDLAVYGADGALFVDCCRVDGFHLAPRSEPPGSPQARFRRGREALRRPGDSLRAVRRGGDFRVGYEEQWRHFADAIRRGVAPSPTLADGRTALEIAVAAAESADSSSCVRIGAAT